MGLIEMAKDVSRLTESVTSLVDAFKKQGFFEVEVDVTNNPMLEQLGFDGKINLKIKMPNVG